MKRLAMLIVVGAVSVITAQTPAKSPIAIPRTPDGKPDFSGMWDNPKVPGSNRIPTVFDRNKFPPLKPGGEAFFEPRTGDPRHDEPRAFCMPSGFPSAFLGPYPVQIIQNAKYLVMITEFMRVTRIVPLDGRPHQTDIEPTYYGDLTGDGKNEAVVVLSHGAVGGPHTVEARVYTLREGRAALLATFPLAEALSCELDHYVDLDEGKVRVEQLVGRGGRCDHNEIKRKYIRIGSRLSKSAIL